MSLRSIIPCVPEPNHRRLVNDCWATKTAKDPDSNALGKLVFYTQSRPVKLAKVSKVLVQYSKTEKYQLVTLAIIRKLLEDCKNEVNVFGEEVVEIIASALRSHDKEILGRAADAFYALAILSPELDYSRLLKQFCALSIDKSSSQHRIIGLHALDGVISSDLFYGSDFKILASPVIPSILHNLEGVDPKALEGDDVDEKQEGSESKEGTRPQMNQRAKSLKSAKGLFEKPPSKDDLGKVAYRMLHTVFESSHPRHLDTSCNYCKGYPWLPSRYMHATPTQYRFAIVNFWLQESISKEEENLPILIDLLSSSSILNLAVGDILSGLAIILARNPASILAREAILALKNTPELVEMLLMRAEEQPEARDAFLECAERLSPGTLEARRQSEAEAYRRSTGSPTFLNQSQQGGSPPPQSAVHHLSPTSASSPSKHLLSSSTKTRPLSTANISLADLKQSLNASASPHTANNSTANTSLEDLGTGSGTGTGNGNGTSMPVSLEKRRLDSIVGNVDHVPHRMTSLQPPYQLS